MLERTKRLPPAPQAERHPTTSTRHGITLVDDYAWLRADNWREVMRDPSLLDPKIRGYLEAENEYVKAALAHTEPLQEALFAEMKGRIKEDDSTVPSPDGPFAYYMRYREGGQHPILCRAAARWWRRAGTSRRRRPRGRQGLFPARRKRALARPHAARMVGRRQGLGDRYVAHARSLHRPRPARRNSRRRGLDRVERGLDRPLLRAARCQSPAFARLSAPPRHARSGRHPRLRGTGQSVLRLARRIAIPALRRDFGARSRNIRELAARSGEPGCEAAACRTARNLGAVRCRASPELGRRREAGDPHQCRQGGGLQGHAGAARQSGARELARSHSAPAWHLRAQHHRALGLADPARARGLASAHRGPAHRER